MAEIHVCSLARLDETARATGAGWLMTLLSPGGVVAVRPSGIAPHRHLTLAVSDIVAPRDGHTHPAEVHVADMLAFFGAWDRATPMLVHCYAGVSRSTAAAFIGTCALAPGRSEHAVAAGLREASPTATPNARLVALADAALGRSGRMIEAVEAIGRGADCFEGLPFRLRLAD